MHGAQRSSPARNDADVPQRLGAAILHHQAGRLREADDLYRQILACDPLQADAMYLSGLVLHQCGEHALALERISRAATLAPRNAAIRNCLGSVLILLGRCEEARRQYECGIELDPLNAELRNGLGVVEGSFSRLDAARTHFSAAVELNPDYPEARRNLGNVLMRTGELQAAIGCFDAALALHPDDHDTRFVLSHALLEAGDFARGWAEYESRFRKIHEPAASQDFPQPVWHGESLAGKTLLVWDEQGIGDAIWNAGLLGDLLHGADRPARLIVQCPPKLTPLYRRSFGGAEVVGRGEPEEAERLREANVQCASGSLGRYLRPRLENFPVRAETAGAYLFPDAAREAYWKRRLAGAAKSEDKLKIGISWRSSNCAGVRALMCTHLTQWGEILRLPGARFVNLQYDECEAELGEAEEKFGVSIERYSEVDMFDDLDETAALMRSLDLVISAPNSVGILSAALGVRTWQLNYGKDWQCHGLPNNPWLPSMMNFVRQWHEPWEAVLGRMAADLQKMTAQLHPNGSGQSPIRAA